MLWIGPSLGPVERACMRSVLFQGHPLSLYCYAAPDGVPDGVELRDAAELIPESEVIRHKSGSFALFSNRFRYALQRAGRGIWLDCDAYLLAPLRSASGHLFGEYEPGRINTGVLRLPPDSPMLDPLLDLFDEAEVPPWLPLRARAAALWRLARTGRTNLSAMPWGVVGPLAFTAIARRYRLDRLALPPDALYPVAWQKADWIRDPSVAVEQVIGSRTLSIHLWNERIKGFKNLPAPAGSFLARLHEEGV